MLPFNFHDHVKAGFLLAFMLFLCYNNARVNFVESPETLDIQGFLKIFGFYLTQADDLGRIVIPKEIRRTLRIREGDPLEIYTEKDGEVIFKKYSPMGDLQAVAAQLCESIGKNTGHIAAVADRDSIIAVAGAPKRELLEKRNSAELEQLMEQRRSYRYHGGESRLRAAESVERYHLGVAAPIVAEGDLMGCVMLLMGEHDAAPTESEQTLAQTFAGFLGKQMES